MGGSLTKASTEITGYKLTAVGNSEPDCDQLLDRLRAAPLLGRIPSRLARPGPPSRQEPPIGAAPRAGGEQSGRSASGRQVRSGGGEGATGPARSLSQAAPRRSRGRWSRFIESPSGNFPLSCRLHRGGDIRASCASLSFSPAAMSNYIHVPPGSPEVPKLDITVSEREGPGCRQGALQLLRRLRPHWRPEEVTLQVRQAGAAREGGRAGWGCGVLRLGRVGKKKERKGGRAAIVRGRAAAPPSPPPPLRRQPPAPSPIRSAARRRGVAAGSIPCPLPRLSFSSSSFRSPHSAT